MRNMGQVKRKTRGKLGYMHRNPVRRGLVAEPEGWPWSSFRHYATGAAGTVEIESNWTARKRERDGAPSLVATSRVGRPPCNGLFPEFLQIPMESQK